MKKILSCMLVLFIISCSADRDLKKWGKNQKNIAQQYSKKNYGTTNYLQKLQPYNFVLDASSPVEPFSQEKLRLSDFPGANNPRGILGNYDLGEMKYVGYIKAKSGIKGFIEVKGQVFTIYRGIAIGKNYGKVIEITPQKIYIEEYTENLEGIWIVQNTELVLYKD